MLYSGRIAMGSHRDSLPPYSVSGVILAQWAYWCSLSMAALSVTYIPPGSLRTMVMLTPVLTGLYAVFVARTLYKMCDEYIRRRLLQCVVNTALVVAGASLAYFLLEQIGYARLSVIWVNLLGWSVFNLQMLFVLFRSR
jgi:hypothetical protein